MLSQQGISLISFVPSYIFLDDHTFDKESVTSTAEYIFIGLLREAKQWTSMSWEQVHTKQLY